MIDRGKVIEELELLSEWLFQQYRVACDGGAQNYYDAYITVDNAIALLREQNETDATIEPCKSCQEWECDGCEWLKRTEWR